MIFITQAPIYTMALTKVTVGIVLDWGAMLSSAFACLLCPHIRPFSQALKLTCQPVRPHQHMRRAQRTMLIRWLDAIIRATKLTNQVVILLAIKTFANTVVTLAESASTAHGSFKRSEIHYGTIPRPSLCAKTAERATPYISRVEDLFQYGKREKIWEVTKPGSRLKSVNKVVSVCYVFFFVIFFRCHINLQAVHNMT